MIIAGLERVTLVDFPGHVAATIFLQGCPFRCKYCHNPELVIPAHYGESISKDMVMDYLRSRQGKLDGVCISGGEPTLWEGLGSFIEDIHSLGFNIKLDTNGFFPHRVQRFLSTGRVHMVAMDVKAPLDRYSDIVGIKSDWGVIKESIDTIIRAQTQGLIQQYMFRTTVACPLIGVEDVHGIGKLIEGSDAYTLQNFVRSKHVGNADVLRPFDKKEMDVFVDVMKNYVKRVFVHY